MHNYNYVKNRYNKGVISVVKANAYGHGLENVIPVFREAGCKYFAVARETEALDILNLGFNDIDILVFETIEDLNLLKNNKNLQMVVNSLEELKEFINLNLNFNQLHLKFDFGFGRNGITNIQLEEVKQIVEKNNIKFKGAMTHLFSADEDEMEEIQKRFMDSLSFLGRDRFEVVHSQNSAAMVLGKGGKGSTHLRCGISLLGLLDIGCADDNIKRSWSLTGTVYHIRDLEGLDFIGYERVSDLELEGGTKIAKIKIGYGDGFSKKNTYLECVINGREYPIVHVSMDTSFVLVDDFVKIGDRVEIYSDFEKSNKHLGMPHYEYITLLNKRLKREVK